jgi:hypothetical protein
VTDSTTENSVFDAVFDSDHYQLKKKKKDHYDRSQHLLFEIFSFTPNALQFRFHFIHQRHVTPADFCLLVDFAFQLLTFLGECVKTQPQSFDILSQPASEQVITYYLKQQDERKIFPSCENRPVFESYRLKQDSKQTNKQTVQVPGQCAHA